jgi:hypothetical protein
LLKAQGATDESLRLRRDLFDGVFAILKKKDDNVAAEKQIRENTRGKNGGHD